VVGSTSLEGHEVTEKTYAGSGAFRRDAALMREQGWEIQSSVSRPRGRSKAAWKILLPWTSEIAVVYTRSREKALLAAERELAKPPVVPGAPPAAKARFLDSRQSMRTAVAVSFAVSALGLVLSLTGEPVIAAAMWAIGGLVYMALYGRLLFLVRDRITRSERWFVGLFAMPFAVPGYVFLYAATQPCKSGIECWSVLLLIPGIPLSLEGTAGLAAALLPLGRIRSSIITVSVFALLALGALAVF
jgi:hypothetical protein